MNDERSKHSSAWINFIAASFFGSVTLLAIGIIYLPIGLWEKGYLAMASVMLLQTAVSLTKTIRDNEESRKMYKRLDETKYEH